ncbi:hypothetical protein [Sphingobacterium faecale]|uniref:Histidine kinase/DNA gyrase B/HSP90-like ATPase n=1 Tax=Sphingobacterium faecale TaxID=2803775 RepID=A0ABS1RAV3_9SPHI|nr:hypothetical protein [Sphingobacterium faecale]MBL1410966.1 hypothetical protein [Sphingobacterium faecale]
MKTPKQIFEELFQCHTEELVDNYIANNSDIFQQGNWSPLGGNENNYGVIENQQASPIAALIEKITNSIDATLMRKCYEADIDPKSDDAPKSMEEARESFFPDYKNWDLTGPRKAQAKNIQILADGPKLNSSLTIYDNGEGQHPEDLENTFLSLLRGNKNEIHFVQGKYNMGGSGAIIFCGKKGYQLIGSRRFDKTGDFGFTLIREHPLSKEEESKKKNTWYEYLKIDRKIPSFKIDKLDLNLHEALFETGSIVKLYSYTLPEGSRSVISRDLNQSLNEFLFNPALPILTVDRKYRYPKDINLERDLYGLQRRLEQSENKYIEDYFSETFREEPFGSFKVTSYVFKSRIDGKNIKETKTAIQSEFFKNNMSVLFSLNGQVHGSYTSEFITRSLKLNLLKHHLLIHVDCTHMDYNFRKELFMASRDRLKDGEETARLRKFLANKLGAGNGQLAQIEKKRKDSISVDTKDTTEMLKSFSKNLPMDSEMMKLLSQTFKLEQKKENPIKKDTGKKRETEEKEPFLPKRFPSFFKFKTAKKDGINAVNLPRGQDKSISFQTDVENHYFDRVEEPGDLKIALVSYNKKNESDGGDASPGIENIEEILNINHSSPREGTIRLNLTAKNSVQVGDEIELKITLSGAGEDFEEIFLVKVADPEAPKVNKEKKDDEDQFGLPPFVLVYKDKKEDHLTWEEVEEGINSDISYETVMIPQVSNENLEKVVINMDSKVLKDFKTQYKSVDQLAVAERKYISSVYFHTLFLYMITKNRKYSIAKQNNGTNINEPVELETYLQDLFSSHYSAFILNFGTNDLLQGISE